jgi:hypothetical protein
MLFSIGYVDEIKTIEAGITERRSVQFLARTVQIGARSESALKEMAVYGSAIETIRI